MPGQFEEAVAAVRKGDYETARRTSSGSWPTKAAAGAQYNLGLMYLNGRGVPQNDVEAANVVSQRR